MASGASAPGSKCVFIVFLQEFEDTYKPALFNSAKILDVCECYETAWEVRNQAVFEWVSEKLLERESKRYLWYYADFDKGVLDKGRVMHSLDDLLAEFAKGEFVLTTYEIDVVAHKVNTEVFRKPLKESKSPSSSFISYDSNGERSSSSDADDDVDGGDDDPDSDADADEANDDMESDDI